MPLEQSHDPLDDNVQEVVATADALTGEAHDAIPLVLRQFYRASDSVGVVRNHSVRDAFRLGLDSQATTHVDASVIDRAERQLANAPTEPTASASDEVVSRPH